MEIKRKIEYLESLGKFKTRTTIGGICLENLIEGFSTVNIDGRGILDRKARVEESDIFGSFIKANKFKGRKLVIEFLLRATDKADLMRKAEKINAYLITEEDTTILFSDDKYSYTGQVTKVSSTFHTSKVVTGEIEIYCTDYRKYGELIRVENIERMKYDYLHPIQPELIELVIPSSADKVKVTNGTTGKYILLEGPFKSEDIIKIYPKKQEIRRGAENMLKYLNLRSNLEDFSLAYGDTVESTNCIINLEFREARI